MNLYKQIHRMRMLRGWCVFRVRTVRKIQDLRTLKSGWAAFSQKVRIVYTRVRKNQYFLVFLHRTQYLNWIRPKIRFPNSCLVKWLFLVVFTNWFDKPVICPESRRIFIAKASKIASFLILLKFLYVWSPEGYILLQSRKIFFSDWTETFFSTFWTPGTKKLQ